MKDDELIKMLEETEAPKLNKDEVKKCESRFIAENFPRIFKMHEQKRRAKKLALVATSVTIIFLVIFGSFALRNNVSGIGTFFSKIGEYIYLAKQNNAIVARVNGEPIYLSDVANKYFNERADYEFQEKYYGKDSLGDPPDPMDVLNEIIDNKLLAQYAKKEKCEIDEVYLNSLKLNAKEWFTYEIHGLPENINLNPISYKYFAMKSEIVKDLFSHSGLTEEEFFEKLIVPGLKDDALIYSLNKKIKDSIETVPAPTEEEIDNFIKTEGRGIVTFAKLSYSSLSEAEEARSSFEKSIFSGYSMLDGILQKAEIAPLSKFTFNDPNELPNWLRDAIDENKKVPYLNIVKNGNDFYLVGIYELKEPLKYSKELAVSLLIQKKIEDEGKSIINYLKSRLRKKSQVEIINEEAVKALQNMH